jgi:hypothetical protein
VEVEGLAAIEELEASRMRSCAWELNAAPGRFRWTMFPAANLRRRTGVEDIRPGVLVESWSVDCVCRRNPLCLTSSQTVCLA